MKNRIKLLRDTHGMSLAKLEELTDISAQQLNRLEKGERRLNEDNIKALCEAFRVPPRLLFESPSAALIPVLGYVGAGAEVFAVDDHAQGAGLEEVECPIGYEPEGIVALRVRGDSMEPQMEDGWVIFYKRESDGVPSDCIGELCVVKLDNDGVLVKKVRQGSKPGYYHLISKNPNSEPIIDAKLAWASRVIDIRPS